MIEEYFTGTHSRIEGVGLEILAREAIAKHAGRGPAASGSETELPIGGNYQFRVNGEYHLLNPETVGKLQHAVRKREFRHVPGIFGADRQAEQAPLHAARADGAEDATQRELPIEEVEPATEIIKRFASGAMSFGSISKEAHETMAIAMNRIGGRVQHGRGRGRRGALCARCPTAIPAAARLSR